MFTYGVFLDFNTAFDTVNHTTLPDKLHHYGIRGILHVWFSSYFGNRTQTMHIDDDHISSLETVVNAELKNVCDWLNANKLSINAKKLNFVVFMPRQKRINNQTYIRIPDNNNKGFDPLGQGCPIYANGYGP